jgi:hypothetical protein
MIRRRHLVVALTIAGSVLGLVSSPVMAATDAIDQTFQTPFATTSTNYIQGEVDIPTLTPGSSVSGGGSMTVIWEGTTIYSGNFTATTLKSITPFGPGGHTFQPLSPTVTTYTQNTIYGYPFYTLVTSPASPTASTGLNVAVQIVPSAGPTVASGQDLIMVCSNAQSVLDVGITLTDPVSSTAAQLLASQPNSLLMSFSDVFGTSSGSLC